MSTEASRRVPPPQPLTRSIGGLMSIILMIAVFSTLLRPEARAFDSVARVLGVILLVLVRPA